jgi:hypothetical protein
MSRVVGGRGRAPNKVRPPVVSRGTEEKARDDELPAAILTDDPYAWLDRFLSTTQPQPAVPSEAIDPVCGRCGGAAGPEGAWCATCIAVCRAYTLSLDLEREATP